MKPYKAILWVMAAGLLVAGAWQWRAADRLRGELAVLRAKAAERGPLEAERARLTAASVSLERLQALTEERAAVADLRNEIDRLRRRAEARARTTATTGVPRVKAERAPTMTEDFVPCAAWKNAGQRTPADAMETALWAAAGGDLKALAAAIVLEPAAREKAHRLLDRLPREVGAQFHTAEDFLALLTTNDVPLSEAHLLAPKLEPPPPDGWTVRVAEFRDEQGQMRVAPVRLYRVSPVEWRLLVPEAAIDKYAAVLAGAGPGGGGK